MKISLLSCALVLALFAPLLNAQPYGSSSNQAAPGKYLYAQSAQEFVQSARVTVTPGTITDTYIDISGVVGKPPYLKVNMDYTGISGASEQAHNTSIALIAPSGHTFYLKYAYPYCPVDIWYCSQALFWDFKNTYHDTTEFWLRPRLVLNGKWTLRIDSRGVSENSTPWRLEGWILNFSSNRD